MNESELPRRRARVTWTLMITWMAVHALGLGLSGWVFASTPWWTFGAPAPGVLLRLGAEVPALVRLGDWQLVLTHAFVHGFVLHVLLNAWVFSVMGGLLETAVGSARTWIVFVIAAAAGGIAHLLLRPDVGLGASGGVFGAAGALGIWALFSKHPLAGTAGRTVLVFLILTGALLLVPNLNVGHEAHYAGLVAGGLTMLLLGPRRSTDAAPGVAVKAAAWLLLLLVLAAGARQVLAGAGATSAQARSFARELNATEQQARRLYQYPRQASPEARAELGRRFELLLASPYLDDPETAAAFRAYVMAWRPVVDGNVPDPFAFDAAMAEARAAWEPFAKRLRVTRRLPSGP